ncbi:hypothetical protein SSP35_32_00050 [Streptomyces sp. NBRC 110611]|nr:hypothetical protein SSP35_32_00050 [Streptomyces sp. NBRC 110611]
MSSTPIYNPDDLVVQLLLKSQARKNLPAESITHILLTDECRALAHKIRCARASVWLEWFTHPITTTTTVLTLWTWHMTGLAIFLAAILLLTPHKIKTPSVIKRAHIKRQE